MKSIYTVFFLLMTITVFAQQKTAQGWLDSGYSDYTKGNFEDAIFKFQASINIDDQNPEAFYLKGVCQSQLDLNTAAIKSYDQALALDSNYAEVHYEKGYSLFALNKFEKAIKSFNKAIELKPDYAEAWFNRGSVKCIIGEKEAAEKDWEKAAELGASIPDLDCE